MYQTDRGEYRTKESAFKQFRKSCLGKIVIALGVFVILLIIAALTKPSVNKMREKMEDNIRQSIWARDSINADGLDIFVSNIGHTFSSFSDPVTDEMRQRWDLFIASNDTSYYVHPFYTTMRIKSHYDQDDERCGIGIFGLVIPTVNFNRFVPRGGPWRNYENPTLYKGEESEEYFGTTTVEPFHWEGE